MSQERIARMMTPYQAALARQDDPITPVASCKVVRDLEALAITEGQAREDARHDRGAPRRSSAKHATARRLPICGRGKPKTMSRGAMMRQAWPNAAQRMRGGPAPGRVLGLPRLPHGCSPSHA